LLEQVKRVAGVIEFKADMEREGDRIRCTLSWSGKPLPDAVIRTWEEQPTRIEGQVTALPLREVLHMHGMQVSAASDPGVTRGAFVISVPAGGNIGGVRWHPAITTGSRPVYPLISMVSGLDHAHGEETRRLRSLSFTVFDTETTGLQPSAGDEIISLGAVRIVRATLLRNETFESLVNPGRAIPAQSTRIHGITDAMVGNQPSIAEVLPKLSRFAEGTVLVAHNGAFDLAFLHKAMREPEGFTRGPVLDTLLLAAVAQPSVSDHSIEGLADRFNVEIAGRHTSLGDAIVTGEIFLKLLPLLEEKGIRTLAEAIEASLRTPYAKLRY